MIAGISKGSISDQYTTVTFLSDIKANSGRANTFEMVEMVRTPALMLNRRVPVLK